MTGRSLARTMSHPEVAVRATPGARGRRRRGPTRARIRAEGPLMRAPPPVRRSVEVRGAASASATSSGRWVTAMTQRRSRKRPDDARAPRPRTSSSRWAVGSSSSTTSAVPEAGPRERQPGPLAGGQAAPVVAELRCPARRAGRRPRRRGPRRAAPPRWRRRHRARAQGEVLADAADGEERPLGHQVGDGGGHAARLRDARRPASSSSRVVLPQPDGPVTTVRPAPVVRSSPSRTRVERPRVGVADPARHDPARAARAPVPRPLCGSRGRGRVRCARELCCRGCRSGSQLGEGRRQRLGAVGRAVELGPHPPDRPVRLRSQQDREQAGAELDRCRARAACRR